MTVQEIFGPGFAARPEREQLERAAGELEAVVLTQLLGAMRRTVPDGGLFKKSLADDVFRSLLDAELARATSNKSPFGLAKAIVRSLENRVKEAPEGTEGPTRNRKPGELAGFRRIG